MHDILQIQTFENLIDPVVESIRFLSDLELDVLSFCIIEHLAAPDKQQLKVNNFIWLRKRPMSLIIWSVSQKPVVIADIRDTYWIHYFCFNIRI